MNTRSIHGPQVWESDTNPTRVIFRRFKGETLALFPGIAATVNTPAHCLSYAHVGQHGAADYAGIVRASRPATLKERAPLAAELRRIGYTLKIARRATAKDRAERLDQLTR